MDRFVNNVFHGDARKLLRALPTASIGDCIADPMFGVAKNPSPRVTYDWGLSHARVTQKGGGTTTAHLPRMPSCPQTWRNTRLGYGLQVP